MHWMAVAGPPSKMREGPMHVLVLESHNRPFSHLLPEQHVSPATAHAWAFLGKRLKPAIVKRRTLPTSFNAPPGDSATGYPYSQLVEGVLFKHTIFFWAPLGAFSRVGILTRHCPTSPLCRGAWRILISNKEAYASS
jgi:hypothetical protein